MKRDMSTIRHVLLRVEEDGAINADAMTWDDPVRHHAILAVEYGLAHGTLDGSVDCLTEKGRDFVDLCRDPDRWERVAHKIEEKVGSAPFDIWEELLRADVREKLSP